MKNRLLSLFLALAMCLTLLPTAALAEGDLADVPLACVCQTRCTEEEKNAECPVCGAENAKLADCCAPERSTDGNTPQEAASETDQPEPSAQPGQETDAETDQPEPSAQPGQEPDGETGQPEPSSQPGQEPADGTDLPEPSAQPEDENEEDPAQVGAVAPQFADNEISVQAGWQLWLYGTSIDVTKDSSGNGYEYDCSSCTLTLKSFTCGSEEAKLYKADGNGRAAYLYSTLSDLTIILEGSNVMGDESVSRKYIKYTNDAVFPVGIYATGTVTICGSGSLTVYSNLEAIRATPITIKECKAYFYSNREQAICAQTDCTIEDNASVVAETRGTNLPSEAVAVQRSLTVKGASLNAIGNGFCYNDEYPNAIYAAYIYVYDGGSIEAHAYNSRDKNSDPHDGRAIRAIKRLYVGYDSNGNPQGTGTVTATVECTGKSTKEGREAVYVEGTLAVSSSGYLSAKTNSKTIGAVYAETLYIQRLDSDGTLQNNIAAITTPAGGTLSENYISFLTGVTAADVEIKGLRRCKLNLGYSSYSKGPVWGYSDNPFISYSGSFDLQKGINAEDTAKAVGPADYQAFQGIAVKAGTHTIELNDVKQSREGNPYITVKKDATLILKISGKNYLAQSSTSSSEPVIRVEDGGTLRVIGETADAALTLAGGGTVLEAGENASVSFEDCVVYTRYNTSEQGAEAGHIGNSFMNQTCDCRITVKNSWLKAAIDGALTVENSTVFGGTYSCINESCKVQIDEKSNVDLRGSGGTGTLPAKVVNSSGKQVYQTVVTLYNCSSRINENKLTIVYSQEETAEMMTIPQVSGLKLISSGSSRNVEPTKMVTSTNEQIVLWLPAGTTVDEVYAFDIGNGVKEHYYTTNRNEAIITNNQNTASGTMYTHTKLEFSNVMALRGRITANNAQVASDYQENGSNHWIDYSQSEPIELGTGVNALDFGIRVVKDGAAEIAMTSVTMYGQNKRIQVDNNAELTLYLSERNLLAASDSDAVLNLGGSGKLTITSTASGTRQLTLQGQTALAGNDRAALIVNNSVLVSECTDKTTPAALGSLSITGSTVIGLGMIRCSNITIDGGSADLSVPVGTTVKNSSGQTLSKQPFVFDGISAQTKVDGLTIHGLGSTSFDTSNIYTDGSGKITLWLPDGAALISANIGEDTYYPVSSENGTTRLSKASSPSFSYSAEESVFQKMKDEAFRFEVTASGVPAPDLQWQQSADGVNWADIPGANGSSYSGTMSAGLHGMQFRCRAVNSVGRSESKTFTLYMIPAVTDTSPAKTTFVPGDDLSLSVRAVSLKDVAVSYQWQARPSNSGTNWADISNETNNTCSIPVGENMDGWRFRCLVTNSADGKFLTVYSDAALLHEHTHSYAADWKTDDANHWHACTDCGEKTDAGKHADTNKDHKCDTCDKKLSEHSGGTATCKDRAKCEICGERYGELNAKNHADLKHIDAKAATSSAEGNIEYWYCSGCGKYYKDANATQEITKEQTVTAKLPSSGSAGTGSNEQPESDAAASAQPGSDIPVSAQTGDSSHLALWLVLLFACGGGAAALTAAAKRKKNHDEK